MLSVLQVLFSVGACLARSVFCIAYRPCACVDVVRILPHTHRHFLGQKNSSNVRADPLLAPYQQYSRLDSLVAHVCYKVNNDVCHTAAILDAAHGNVERFSSQLTTSSRFLFTEPFFANNTLRHQNTRKCRTLWGRA